MNSYLLLANTWVAQRLMQHRLWQVHFLEPSKSLRCPRGLAELHHDMKLRNVLFPFLQALT